MITLNKIVENGVTFGERYNSLKYQTVLNAVNPGVLSYTTFLSTNKAIENHLTADMLALLPGFKVATETRERAALFSLEYSGAFADTSFKQTDALTAMLTAMKTGDRAEAWYDMRYMLNSAQQTSLAREHFAEAQVFGLFQAAAPVTRADVTVQESLLAARAATAHYGTIASYEAQYAAQITLARQDVDTIGIRTKSDYGTVGTIDDMLAPAVDRLVHDFTDLTHLAPDLIADLSNDSALVNMTIDHVWVAPDLGGQAHVVDRSEAPTSDDLIFGSIKVTSADSGADDTLAGGFGNDFFIGGRGADAMYGGSGEDTVSYLASTKAVKLDLSQGIGTGGDALGDTFNNIENILGGSANDLLTGDGANNTLYGGAGNDRLVGGVGSDVLIGSAGADKLYGDALNQKDTRLNSTAQGDLTHGNTLVAGLGGDAGFGEQSLARNDDGSTGAIDISSVFGEDGLNFFGTTYTQLFVNNNGNITFNSALDAYTPGAINAGVGNPIIAAFWADVDTRSGEGFHDLVYYDLDSAHGVFTVTWDQVGYYNRHTSPSNSFQLQLIKEGNGNFDIVLRYQQITWTSGDASNGVPARAGYAAGNGHDYFELTQSGDDAAMQGLPNAEGNTGVDGLFVFHVINGQIFDANDTIDGGAGADLLMGGVGADLFVFHAGEANGDTVADFNSISGDRLQFEGYGEDATFTKIDSTHWQIGSDIITFTGAPIITAGDYIIG